MISYLLLLIIHMPKATYQILLINSNIGAKLFISIKLVKHIDRLIYK